VQVIEYSEFLILTRLEQHRPRRVTEQHARRAIIRVRNRRHHIGADDHDLIMSAGRDKLGADS
jgi:hypothetical protein